jgi:hypothetical protein
LNTSALKSFAPAVRTQLMEAVTRKLDFVLTGDTADLRAAAAQRQALRTEATRDRAGLIERVAYTWFNRLAALRFIDARGWHPFRARVLTAATPEETQPELLKLLRSGALPEELKAHTQPARLNDLLDGRIPSADAQGEVYRHLVLATCRFYHALLPSLFEKLDDETELLLPDDLLTEHSVVHGFRTEISDADCSEVEILGWLYQFYISEKKDAVMARKSAVPTEDIPAVTQLFTPHWIVRYLVENSLGRLWLLNRPQSKLREHMPYYIESGTDSSSEASAKEDFLKITKPEEIRLCDPAVGSGHMLTYAFDLLTLIYEEEGYAPTEIPALILRHNLHGLEICPRAAQLAELALVFKAREKSRRFFQPEHLVRPQIIELRDVRFDEGELAAYFKALGIDLSGFSSQPSGFVKLLHQFEEAKNFGSLIQPCLSEAEIQSAWANILDHQSRIAHGAADLMVAATHLKVLRVLEQAEALTQRYHVVVANPPYMGSGNFNQTLRAGLEGKYKITRTDLYAIFMERSIEFVVPDGFLGMIAMQSWMFTSSYTELREKIVGKYRISSLVQLGARAFASIAGEVVSTAMFCVQAAGPSARQTIFVRLTDGDAVEKEAFFHLASNRFKFSQPDFKRVPGSPMVYWVGLRLVELYEKLPPVGNLALFREGLHTADNGRFVRQWWEVQSGRFGRGETSYESIKASGARWIPYNKGGGCIRWYGNYEYVVAFDEDSRNAMDELKGHIRPSQSLYFKEGGTWSDIGSKGFGVKYYPSGFLFDAKGPVCVGANIEVLIAGLNSAPFSYLAELLMPTISYKCGTVKTIPFPAKVDSARVETTSNAAISLARADWDNFETSWDFRDQPLLRSGLKGAKLEASWRNWEAQSNAAIRGMQELETENNRLFIAAYGLDGELQPEVPEDQITLARADAKKDMAAFLSYALGCMMGRYSLDHPGLILANAGDTLADYLAKVGKPQDQLTFVPDEDGIIPVLDGEWFEDDIVARTRDFLRATFGPDTLNENLRFIEDSLGKDLRKYFLTDFYKDHLQTYKKRPIYWLVQSPKKGFSVLIYLHRYTKDTFNLILNRYLRDYQVKLRNRLAHLAEEQVIASTAKAKTEARKESEKLTKVLHECEEWERQVLLPLAQQRIELDLDDGVKTNYLKLAEALAPIPGLAAKEEE